MSKKRVPREDKQPIITKFVPKNATQEWYMDAILDNDVVLAKGCAGTGKTAVAVNLALQLIIKGEFKKLVITRPAVEAGENLGFLPGGLEDKMSPYLQPVYDAFGETVNQGLINTWLANKVIEIVPVAYMRGRTFKDTFIMVDEAQNLSIQQLTMILTRLGEGSKLIINGDSEQSDLPYNKQGGLDKCIKRLAKIEGIEVVTFTKKDSVRHPLIEKMLSALSD